MVRFQRDVAIFPLAIVLRPAVGLTESTRGKSVGPCRLNSYLCVALVLHRPLYNLPRFLIRSTPGIYTLLLCYLVLYGCATWSLTLREECRLRVFENRVLRRIFGPKRDNVTGV